MSSYSFDISDGEKQPNIEIPVDALDADRRWLESFDEIKRIIRCVNAQELLSAIVTVAGFDSRDSEKTRKSV
jgi:hypothetical protein